MSGEPAYRLRAGNSAGARNTALRVLDQLTPIQAQTLAAILSERGPVSRMVVADWLEERGWPRRAAWGLVAERVG